MDFCGDSLQPTIYSPPERRTQISPSQPPTSSPTRARNLATLELDPPLLQCREAAGSLHLLDNTHFVVVRTGCVICGVAWRSGVMCRRDDAVSRAAPRHATPRHATDLAIRGKLPDGERDGHGQLQLVEVGRRGGGAVD